MRNKALVMLAICLCLLPSCGRRADNMPDSGVQTEKNIPAGNTGHDNSDGKDAAEGQTGAAAAEDIPAPTVGIPADETEFDIYNEALAASPSAIAAAFDAGCTINVERWSADQVKSFFFATEIDDGVFERIKGISYPEGCPIPLGELRYIRVLHMGFDGLTHIGELIVSASIADDTTDIFYKLFLEEYPIEKMLLIDVYGGDDELSMADNNTSAFNYRYVNNSTVLSNHAYGLAIDINPLYNPYVRELPDGGALVLPSDGAQYAGRGESCLYYIDKDSVCYGLFAEKGFKWGGDWNTVKDYQHFEKPSATDH